MFYTMIEWKWKPNSDFDYIKGVIINLKVDANIQSE